MSLISSTFQSLRAKGRKALIPYITTGDPDLDTSLAIMHGLVKAGADIIELGIPFSDPMADGPVIQRSSERALKGKTTVRGVLDVVARFRKTDKTTPVVLMGYGNPIEAMGYEKFSNACKDAGVDGVLIVDYPPEESHELTQMLKMRGIDSIFLLSPTSKDSRMADVGRVATGYIYYVSLKGVTGAASLDLEQVQAMLPRIRAHSPLPVGVGFGIRDARTAHAVAQFADAVVVGSRIVQEIENSSPGDVVGRVGRLVKEMRDAIDA
ncbi:MAG: tryptophan synthase subunit alpha [Betaproteobacteria bacterium]|nr:tryptophan synthase subunit alpha [Betaproteobacteria bacterium]